MIPTIIILGYLLVGAIMVYYDLSMLEDDKEFQRFTQHISPQRMNMVLTIAWLLWLPLTIYVFVQTLLTRP